ncbi:hypothetical protein HZC00_03020 [Candidatus Kaiserbacteria bacterium]|nr:hypothetical protein [Candidatus Kaiserbacteria bacterium]
MMSDFYRRYAGVMLVAVLAGVFTLAPQVILYRSLGGQYAGIRQEMNPDEGYYMTRQQDVIDGHVTLGNPYLYEHKDEPGLQVWIPDAILAWGSYGIFRDVHTGAMAWDFVLPGVIVLLTYAVLMLYTREHLVALSLTGFASIGLYLEVFNRSPSPQFNFVFYLAFLALFLQAIITRKRSWTIMAALSLGSLFYVYTYYWTYAFVFLGFAGAASFVWMRQERIHETIAKVFGIGLVLGIPYFLMLRETAALAYYQESLARVGMITTHSPSGIFIVAAGAITLLLMGVLWRTRILPLTPVSLVAAAGVLAGPIVTNQHIVTGLNLEFSSHYHLISMYADFFAIALCVQALLRRVGSWRDFLEQVILSFIIAFSLASALQTMQRQIVATPAFIAAQRYAPVLHWLNEYTKKDDVVYTDQTLSNIMPAYTHDNVFFSGAAGLYIMPQSDMRARFLAAHYFDPALTREIMTDGLSMERQVYGNYYIEMSAHMRSLNKLRRVFGLSPLPVERYPEADIASLIQEWQAQKSYSFMQILSQYRVDYVVSDRATHPEWRIDTVQGLHKVFEDGDIVVYTP